MRVLYLPGYRYPASLEEPLTSGDLRYSFNLSRALARAGASVRVLTRRAAGDPETQELDGVRVVRYRPALGALFPTSFDVSPARLRRFRRLVAGADVVVAHSPLSLEAALRLPCPLVYVCSGLEDVRNYGASPRELLQRAGIVLLRDPLKRLTWRRAARVDTTATAEEATLLRMGVPQGRVATIGPGVELQRYHPRGGPEVAALRGELARGGAETAKIVLSVSRFTPAKGLLETLDAFAELGRARGDVTLVLAGVRHSHRAGYPARVRERVGELGLEGGVVFVEDIPEARLPLYYSAADVTSVFSVGYDPLPTVIIESMSCGTPVVSTDFETRRQMIRPGETGLMVPERDGAAWAAAVSGLLDDRGMRDRLATAALEDVRARFDMDRVAADWLALFQSLGAGR